MNIKNLLGKRIQEIRKRKHLKQEQLAEMINIETASLSNIERGKYYPTADNLDKILKVLNVTPRELFDFEHLAPKEELINEMTAAMNKDTGLTELMYKFFKTIA